jgi:hypothetical protein
MAQIATSHAAPSSQAVSPNIDRAADGNRLLLLMTRFSLSGFCWPGTPPES